MDRQALATTARQRRLELDLTLDDVAAATGMSRMTIRAVETGKRVMPRTLYRLDRAYGYVPGALEGVLYLGRPPTLAPVEVNTDDPTEVEIWGLTRLAEDTRRALIAELRRQRRGGDVAATC